MPRGKGFRDKLLVVTLILVLVFSRVINRGLLLVSGIVVRSLSTISSRNVPHSSRRMAINALRSRVGISLSIKVLPIILQ
jgi:phosphatidylglycerophosphate synthase